MGVYLINTIRRIIFKFIFRNLYLYELGIFFARYTNFLLPHEEDIYGLNYLKLENEKNIIDVGASDGLYFKSLRYMGINNRYNAFEPLKKNKKYLIKIKKKSINFKFHITALGDKNTQLTLYTPFYKKHFLYNWSSFSIKECKYNLLLRNFNINLKKLEFKKHKVKQRKLDFFKFKPTLIKIDVEGYENSVLLGAIKTIKKFKPIIYVENNLKQKKSNTINFFKQKLLKLGYNAYTFNFEQKTFLNYSKKNISGRFFSYNVYFITKDHFR